MNSPVRLHPRVLATRQLLADGRDKLRKQYEAGSPGIQLGFYLTDLLDQAVLQVFEALVEDHARRAELLDGIALVAHSGYGRRDNAPYSDVDLMLLHAPKVTPMIPEVAGRLVQDLSDAGVDLGFSVRTPRQACQLSAQDPIICTALTESRFLTGNEHLFERFFEKFRKTFALRSGKLIKAIEQSRLEERRKYGETVYLLEPNVKRSRGGLRDIHLLRWVGFVAYGESLPRQLKQMGHLSASDHAKLRDARDFLLLLRHGLHFEAGNSQDVLTKPEQLRMAEQGDYSGDEGVLPVERFMQEYFRHTTSVRNIVSHFVAAAKWNSPGRMAIHNLFGRTIANDYLVGPRYVSARAGGRTRVKGDLVETLRLMDLSNRFDKRIDHDLWKVIRESMMETEIESVSSQAASFFLSLLSEPARLGKLLRRLHELRVLDKLVPGWSHARCLLQFNDYHKYTVDEHSLRVVERATEFAQQNDLLGRAYREIKQKSTFHLALLIHDIGKGFVEDHSQVGKRLALPIGRHLNMSEKETDRLVFLVHRHLMLNHLAFRRDNSDQAILLEVASEIGSPENLRMLFVLSCADLAAVGPGVLNQWKLQVLSDLYERLMETLSGGTSPKDIENRWDPQRQELLKVAAGHPHAGWLRRQIQVLPPAYLQATSAATILDDLQRLQPLARGDATAWGRYHESPDVSEYSIAAHENVADGIFHRLAGAITSQGLQILSAEIHSLADDLFLDRFFVHDPDFQGPPPSSRFEQVSNQLVTSLHEDVYAPPTFRRLWQTQRDSSATLTTLPTQIRVDNSTSDRFTILDVFTHDRPGLLFAIAKSLHEQELSVQIAKIGTYIDQVVDVFYVTDQSGQKVDDEMRIAEIRSNIYHAIESWDE